MTDDKEETANELAMERTDWAEDRTIMANERTFAGWMRTGMASVALALGMKAVFGDFEPVWAAKATASVFIVLACYIFFTARQQSCATQARMNDHAATPKSNASMTITAAILSIGAILTGVILWLL
ncbi:DUF202 domain-containing protein [Rhodobacteraceae bacterium M385]|nr:DUF202 domain-containing protein [Rhodobacteraceae bacterium M385]